jgi:hypothetical protein
METMYENDLKENRIDRSEDPRAVCRFIGRMDELDRRWSMKL